MPEMIAWINNPDEGEKKSSKPSSPFGLKNSQRHQLSRQNATRQSIREPCSLLVGDHRLSDVSVSTDSSDSPDFLVIPDFNTQLPFPVPPSNRRLNSIDVDGDDEDEEDEEEPEDIVSPESDPDQEATTLPQGRCSRSSSNASASGLHRALRGNFRKMSGAFSSLMTPEKRAIHKIRELSSKKNSYFGSLVQDFLSFMNEGAETQSSELEMLQTIRQFMTQMKSYLLQSSEIEPKIHTFISEEDIDQVLEKALLKVVLKPLRPVVSEALHSFQVRSGEWQKLKENLSSARTRTPQEMGMANIPPPTQAAIEKIKQKLQALCKLYKPEKKVVTLLRVCKLIYHIMEENSGRLYGADEFLPMLTYVLAQCDMPQLDSEILYMMELLDPSQLHGEGGYYLTSAYGAMSVIKNFQENQTGTLLTSETRDTLNQWHRRRTTQRAAPCIEDLQNYLRVALQDEGRGCTAKTLMVQPWLTAEQVCQLCAQKFEVSEPQNYGLFLLTEGDSQQLSPGQQPQKIKAELYSRGQEQFFCFVFRPVATGEASTMSSDPKGNQNSNPLAPQHSIGSAHI